MSMTLEEKAVFADNGIKCQVAMMLEVGGLGIKDVNEIDPVDYRNRLDAMVMSLPLATALAITKIKVGYPDQVDQFTDTRMEVTLVPEALAVEEMFNKVSEICEQAFEVFFFGTASDVHFLAAETEKASVHEPPALSLPGRKIALLDGEVTE